MTTTADAIESDIDAMIRLKSGEDLALSEIMSRWEKPLITFIYRTIGNEQEAADLAQQTFVRVFENKHRYNPTGKFSSYLFTIAINLCRNHRRWLVRHPTISLEADKEDGSESLKEPIDPASLPSQKSIQNETTDEVKKAVLNLPTDLKTALILFEYEGLSYDEISKILNCSSKAVETRLYRARNILKDKLAALIS